MNDNNFFIQNQYKEIISEIIANELSDSFFDLMEMTTKERVKIYQNIRI